MKYGIIRKEAETGEAKYLLWTVFSLKSSETDIMKNGNWESKQRVEWSFGWFNLKQRIFQNTSFLEIKHRRVKTLKWYLT